MGKILIRKMLLVMLMIVVVLDHSWRRRRGRGRAFQVDCCRDVVIRRGHCKFRLEKEKERDRNCTKAPPSFLCQYEPAAALDNQIKSPYRKMLISMYCLSSSSSPACLRECTDCFVLFCSGFISSGGDLSWPCYQPESATPLIVSYTVCRRVLYTHCVDTVGP